MKNIASLRHVFRLRELSREQLRWFAMKTIHHLGQISVERHQHDKKSEDGEEKYNPWLNRSSPGIQTLKYMSESRISKEVWKLIS